MGSLVAAHGLRWLCSVWGFPGPGMEPRAPVLGGGFLTTEPPVAPPHFGGVAGVTEWTSEDRRGAWNPGQPPETPAVAWTVAPSLSIPHCSPVIGLCSLPCYFAMTSHQGSDLTLLNLGTCLGQGGCQQRCSEQEA